ncbi:MAG: aldehyde dehydrogenase family protein [Spirochaetales bacterium]|nr:aldehyde dehydrogenase family protein [Spirochaetales bacterium]
METLTTCFAEMTTFFGQGATRDPAFRKAGLRSLKSALLEHEAEILEALNADLQKSKVESWTTELGIVLEQISYHLKRIDRWTRPTRVRTTLSTFPSTSCTIAEPKGVVLIISPWNYPLQLALVPLVSAIAAGNCAIVKPSRQSRHTSLVIEKILSSIYPSRYVATFTEGDLLSLPFDHIFFTGSTRVGELVMKRASEHLSSVTLELGGKSPTIVDASANLALAAKRIIWGKTLNAGQTCIAPDYVLVERKILPRLVEHLKDAIKELWGLDPLNNPDYPSIISHAAFDRLIALFEDGKLAYGGQIDPKRKRIAPTLLLDPVDSAPVMEEEIFGPILPIIPYDTIDEAIAFVRQRPKPLALYLFSRNREAHRRITCELSCGGCCINDVVMHLANVHLPFGGVGASGQGAYHAEEGFRSFSHIKPVLTSHTFLDVPLRYPPYTERRLKLIQRIFSR